MSSGQGCTCPKTPDRRAAWRVVQYRCNFSAFNGYRCTPSRYSGVRCLRCWAYWRTAAAYVETLPGFTDDEPWPPAGWEDPPPAPCP